MTLLDPLFGWEAVNSLFSDRRRIQGMLDFEGALARAEACVSVIPVAAADVIGAKCRAELFDIDSLARDAALAGNAAIPLVRHLTGLVGETDAEAARFVHWGATSQDAIDTGFILQLRDALDIIEPELARLADASADLARRYRAAPLAGRTWMQQALPLTLGLKFAGWLDAIDRHRERLAEARSRALVVQLGGAVGTLASLGERGIEVAEALGRELRLAVPATPWHSHRDRVGEIATVLGLVTGTLGKIAGDIALHMQTEVAEIFEPAAEGRGGSSTMPQKRNPVAAAVVLAAALRVPPLVGAMLAAMVQEQERGLGGWHAEWEVLPEILRLSAGALHHLTESVTGLEIDTEKMKENLDLTRGLIFAEAVQMVLGQKLGRLAAHDRVAAACKRALTEKQHLRDVLAGDTELAAHLRKAELDRLFDPVQYLGVTERLIDRVLEAHSRFGAATAQRRGEAGR
ncbi:MAG: 3-carboxy-cis,cis-muconate cycloisomerase [Acidobacteriota bacterium]|nr:3-carboxy-cis,cis-muconate cycloisomerase [Acidobacteriota bacterium]